MRPSRFIRETVELRDGRSVVIRPIDRSDSGRLIDLHNELSFESQYYRFFGPKPRLSPAEAEYLANVDFHTRFAIVAEVEENETKLIVGVGRFDINEPGTAEAAIVIRDDYQHVGLGTAMLQRMREIGRGAGLKAFSAEVLAENTRMIELLNTGGVEITQAQEGVVRVAAPLDQPVLMLGFKIATQVVEALTEKRPPND
ncbi:MAG: GNAT family N-acetyltransferase [Actinomycetota bacterium]